MTVADAPELAVVLGGGVGPDGGPFPSTKARAHRAAEVEVERGGQQETVGNQGVCGIERRIVEHLEIDRAMR